MKQKSETPMIKGIMKIVRQVAIVVLLFAIIFKDLAMSFSNSSVMISPLIFLGYTSLSLSTSYGVDFAKDLHAAPVIFWCFNFNAWLNCQRRTISYLNSLLYLKRRISQRPSCISVNQTADGRR
jgi:hypothetical protein